MVVLLPYLDILDKTMTEQLRSTLMGRKGHSSMLPNLYCTLNQKEI